MLNVAGMDKLSVRGGKGGIGAKQNCGGNGGLGRIRIDSVVLSGTVSSEYGKLEKKNIKNLYYVSIG